MCPAARRPCAGRRPTRRLGAARSRGHVRARVGARRAQRRQPGAERGGVAPVLARMAEEGMCKIPTCSWLVSVRDLSGNSKGVLGATEARASSVSARRMPMGPCFLRVCARRSHFATLWSLPSIFEQSSEIKRSHARNLDGFLDLPHKSTPNTWTVLLCFVPENIGSGF